MQFLRSALVVVVVLVAFPKLGFSQFLSDRDIEADDNHRLMAGGRLAYEIFPGNETRRRGSLLDLIQGTAPIVGERADGKDPRRGAFLLALGGDLSGGTGRDQFSLGASEEITRGGQLTGPARVDAQADWIRGNLNVRVGGRFHDVVSLEAMFGVALQRLEFNLGTSGGDLDYDQNQAAFALGARLGVRPIPLFDLYGQWKAMVGDFLSFDAEIGAQLNVTPNVGIYSGYRRWTQTDKSGDSDVEFQFSGPTLGMSLTF
ncbi:MAG: hypothetical protein AB8G23_24885 [Myxococcota bacterium]